jgi:hypothetical protein
MRSKSIRLLLVVAISSSIIVFPAYLRYADLSETDLSSTDLIFENPDQDDQLNDQQHESDGVLLSLLSVTFLPYTHLLNPFFLLSAPDITTRCKTSILRC